jgi:hypothetical protein
VMRASISCRLTVLSINSWMPMSAVVRGMAGEQLPSGFPGPVNGAAWRQRSTCSGTGPVLGSRSPARCH